MTLSFMTMSNQFDTDKFLIAAKEIKNCFIGHSAIEKVLSELSDTHKTSTDAILIGQPGLGKTTALRKYRDRYLRSYGSLSTPTVDKCPILCVSMPADLNQKSFVVELLTTLDASISKCKTRKNVPELTKSLINQIENREVTMVMIDEFQNLLSNSRVKSSQTILSTIKYIMGETKVPFVLTGTPQGWQDLLAYDDGAMADRFQRHITLTPFTMTSVAEVNRFIKFLKTLAQWLSDYDIDASCLKDPEMASNIFKCTAGVPRKISALVRTALTEASHTATGPLLERRHFEAAFPKLYFQKSGTRSRNPFAD